MTSDCLLNFSTLPRVKLSSVELAYIERGQDGPLVLCLHGFPDIACTWLPLLDKLAAQGYRAIAPFTRGYYPSGLAADGDYSVVTLAKDVLELVEYFAKPDAEGRKHAIVIGHDWGGLAAYTAANIAPDKISKLVVAGVPHVHKAPFTFGQLLKSWYVFLFQLPWLPECLVGRNHFRFIDLLYANWSPQWTADTEHLDNVKASLSSPGALSAALGYYRCMVRRFNRADWEIMRRKTTVPALVFVGQADGSTGRALFTTSGDCYEQLRELVKMPGVGHFPHLEDPDLFASKVLAFLQD